MAVSRVRYIHMGLQTLAGMALRASRLRPRASALFILLMLGPFATSLLAAPLGKGNPPLPASSDSGNLKTIGVILLLALVIIYRKYIKNYSARKKYKKNKLHDEQVEIVVNLKKKYKLYHNQIYPNDIPDNKLTVECQSCQKVNLIYAAHCKYCDEFLSLDSTIKTYEEKINEMEFKIKASGLPLPVDGDN